MDEWEGEAPAEPCPLGRSLVGKSPLGRSLALPFSTLPSYLERTVKTPWCLAGREIAGGRSFHPRDSFFHSTRLLSNACVIIAY